MKNYRKAKEGETPCLQCGHAGRSNFNRGAGRLRCALEACDNAVGKNMTCDHAKPLSPAELAKIRYDWQAGHPRAELRPIIRDGKAIYMVHIPGQGDLVNERPVGEYYLERISEAVTRWADTAGQPEVDAVVVAHPRLVEQLPKGPDGRPPAFLLHGTDWIRIVPNPVVPQWEEVHVIPVQNYIDAYGPLATPTQNPFLLPTVEECAKRYAQETGAPVNTIVVPFAEAVDTLTEEERALQENKEGWSIVFHFNDEGTIVSGEHNKGRNVHEVLHARGQEMPTPMRTLP